MNLPRIEHFRGDTDFRLILPTGDLVYLMALLADPRVQSADTNGIGGRIRQAYEAWARPKPLPPVILGCGRFARGWPEDPALSDELIGGPTAAAIAEAAPAAGT